MPIVFSQIVRRSLAYIEQYFGGVTTWTYQSSHSKEKTNWRAHEKPQYGEHMRHTCTRDPIKIICFCTASNLAILSSLFSEIIIAKFTGRSGYFLLSPKSQTNIRRLSINKYSRHHEVRFVSSRMFGAMAQWSAHIVYGGITIVSAIERQGNENIHTHTRTHLTANFTFCFELNRHKRQQQQNQKKTEENAVFENGICVPKCGLNIYK